MALYQERAFVTHTTSASLFDEESSPGTVVYVSGIYRCKNCGDEIAANKLNPLPPQNHHQHNALAGPVVWKLLVAAVQK